MPAFELPQPGSGVTINVQSLIDDYELENCYVFALPQAVVNNFNQTYYYSDVIQGIQASILDTSNKIAIISSSENHIQIFTPSFP